MIAPKWPKVLNKPLKKMVNVFLVNITTVWLIVETMWLKSSSRVFVRIFSDIDIFYYHNMVSFTA